MEQNNHMSNMVRERLFFDAPLFPCRLIIDSCSITLIHEPQLKICFQTLRRRSHVVELLVIGGVVIWFRCTFGTTVHDDDFQNPKALLACYGTPMNYK